MYAWVLQLLRQRYKEGEQLMPPPIVATAYRMLSEGLVSFEHARSLPSPCIHHRSNLNDGEGWGEKRLFNDRNPVMPINHMLDRLMSCVNQTSQRSQREVAFIALLTLWL